MEFEKICSFIKGNVYFNLFLIVISFWIGVTFSGEGSLLYAAGDLILETAGSGIETGFMLELMITLYCIAIYFIIRIMVNLIVKLLEYHINT